MIKSRRTSQANPEHHSIDLDKGHSPRHSRGFGVKAVVAAFSFMGHAPGRHTSNVETAADPLTLPYSQDIDYGIYFPTSFLSQRQLLRAPVTLEQATVLQTQLPTGPERAYIEEQLATAYLAKNDLIDAHQLALELKERSPAASASVLGEIKNKVINSGLRFDSGQLSAIDSIDAELKEITTTAIAELVKADTRHDPLIDSDITLYRLGVAATAQPDNLMLHKIIKDAHMTDFQKDTQKLARSTMATSELDDTASMPSLL